MKTSKTICFNLRSGWQHVSRMYNSYASEHDVSVSIAYVLLNLSREEGVPSTQIAPMLGMEPSSLTRLLKNLEEKKLIRKKSDESDARQVLIFLTTEGERKKEVARRIVRRFNNRVRQNIPEQDLEIFLKTLNKINEVASQNYMKKS